MTECNISLTHPAHGLTNLPNQTARGLRSGQATVMVIFCPTTVTQRLRHMPAREKQPVKRVWNGLLIVEGVSSSAAWAVQVEGVWVDIPQCQAKKVVNSLSDGQGKAEKCRRGALCHSHHHGRNPVCLTWSLSLQRRGMPSQICGSADAGPEAN
jgi:hypothetical protein